ncbi:MAG: response regulator [Bacteroidales bacterium]
MKNLFYIILFNIIVFPLFAQDNTNKLRTLALREYNNNYVLILNTYRYENVWGNSLSKKIRNDLYTKFHGLLVKTGNASANEQKTFSATRATLTGVMSETDYSIPKLIIIIGPEAWMTYRKMTLYAWSTVPILLCGMQETILKDYEYFLNEKLGGNVSLEKHMNSLFEKENFVDIPSSSGSILTYGVLLKDNTTSTIALIKQKMPLVNEIEFIGNEDYSDIIIANKLHKQIQSTFGNSVKFKVSSFDNIANKTRQTNKCFIVRDINLSFPNTITPTFSLNDIETNNNNIIGGSFSTITNYATQICDMAEKIINKKPIANKYIIYNNNKVVLNKVALIYNKLEQTTVYNAIIRNIPDSFIKRNAKYLAILLLSIISSIIFIIRYFKNRNYKLQIKNTLLEYTNLYNEYNAVYQNMPIGAIVIKADGSIQEYNNEGKRLIEEIYKTSIKSFNMLSGKNFITDSDRLDLEKNKELDKKIIIKLRNDATESKLYLKLIIHTLEQNDTKSFIIIIIDNTQVTNQRRNIENTNTILNKALVESQIGLCRLNLFNNKGFATKTWFDNLGVKQDESIIDSFSTVYKEDYKYIEDYINEVKNIQFNENEYLAFAAKDFKKTLNSTIKVIGINNKEHYLRLYSEISKYNPDGGEIITDFLTLNIDDQKEREIVLEQTYLKTKEAEELKQSFIVNMGKEIRTPLNIITLSCMQLLNNINNNEKKYLFEKIEINTNKLLSIITDVVNNSKGKVKSKELHKSLKQEDTTQKTILIAEDNENNFQLLKYMIKTKYKIIHAWNGDEAVLMYKNLQPNVILMDIKMPIMDGYKATEIIRKFDTNVPIIAVTAYAFDNDKNKILNNGFNYYLPKPVNEVELFKLLDQCFQN